jgi:hypothetical protein
MFAVDTHNRDYNGTDFKAGLLPSTSRSPPNASYSGLLECPCTTRTMKEIFINYVTQSTGVCSVPLTNVTECFLAAANVKGSLPTTTQKISSSSRPAGCFIVSDVKNISAYTAVYNDAPSSVVCGQGGTLFMGQEISTVTNISMTITMDNTTQQVQISLSGPTTVWFGVGFNASAMGDFPYAIILDGSGNVTERQLGEHNPGKGELKRSLFPNYIFH